ncbi:MAG: 50S ribosomal protein L6 [Candidatus Eisenbacteria bacterium]
MSRVGKKPIPIPKGVTVSVNDGRVTAEGPLGELSFQTRPEVAVKLEDSVVEIENLAGLRGEPLTAPPAPRCRT